MDNEYNVLVWKRLAEGSITNKTAPVWICPSCGGGKHQCVDGISDEKKYCPKCLVSLRYPWEDSTGICN